MTCGFCKGNPVGNVGALWLGRDEPVWAMCPRCGVTHNPTHDNCTDDRGHVVCPPKEEG